ncbi:hypothetical protein EW146_g7459 [Bondarzewia mesenterica]|uniref:GDP/GTP exchange factor Sec2 N-terminal domain-containing protein n=1 Tax=Bondarzewia mesenterica TaxID=1095465 RepID=A0A4S4LRD5_9AGAM|nr:hypothetical protein EW146_g7459 [Bondarzewia mesenterica]
MPPPTSSRALPKRSDSLHAPIKNSQLFATIDDEMRDCKRVETHGQEEDLREALTRMMLRVEELCSLLKSSYQANSDVETTLTLAQSNLKLAFANNEMLEDALRRNSLSSDVGWRRSSRETSHLPTQHASSQSQRPSLDEGDHGRKSLESPDVENPPPSAATPSTISPSQDSRFFRFRFSSGRTTPTQPHSPDTVNRPLPNGTRSPSLGPTSHLTSASLPSLLPTQPSHEKELEELRAKLKDENQKYEKLVTEKKNLESELESLSQALFEEVGRNCHQQSVSFVDQANKMVAMERIRRAEAEEEAKEAHMEKEALRSALKLVESENGRLRIGPIVHSTQQNDHYSSEGEEDDQVVARFSHSRSSSRIALKSPPPQDVESGPSSPIAFSPPFTAKEESSSIDGFEDAPSSPAPGSPAPLYVPPPHLTNSPESRTNSPLPLPHPHRPSQLRSTIVTQQETEESDSDSILGPALLRASNKERNGMAHPPPAPPPPSAADDFPNSPWSREPEESEHRSLTFTPPPDELDSPWADR